jgi:hypothetical protein
MTLQERTKAFEELGAFLDRYLSGQTRDAEAPLHEGLNQLIEKAHIHNNWFIPNFVNEALHGLAYMLTPDKLQGFIKSIPDEEKLKTVAIICAGNVPLVGFHDLMCVLLSGNKLLVKLSSDDDVLLPFFLRLLVHYQPGFENRIRFAEGKLSNFDAVIASGSNNTSQHLRYYFGKYPHIIRGSRTSVAVLEGNEDEKELAALGRDIFLYFGLGCRSVSKLYVPAGYNFNRFFESIVDFGFVVNNKKYGNNYDYNRAIYLLERKKFLDNNFLMLMESNELFSPVSVLYHEPYENQEALNAVLEREKDRLQCIVGRNFIPFGYSQLPVISEFADGIDTLRFLVHL